MSTAELLNDGEGHDSDSDDDDEKPRTSPIQRGWNRFAAEGYNYVNNNNESTPLEFEEEDSSGSGRGKAEKQLCVLLVLSLLVIISLLAALLILSFAPDQSQNESCQSPDCVMVAGSMLSKMDLELDPCNDFYDYACNVVVHDPLTPPSSVKWGLFQQIAKRNSAVLKKLLEKPGSEYKGVNSTAIHKTKLFYNTCMNHTAREDITNEPLLKIINDLGSWPLTSDSVSGQWDPNTWSIEKTLAKVLWYEVTALFAMGVGADDKNSSVQRLVFDQGGTVFTNTEFYTANDTKKYQEAFIKIFVSVTKLLGVNESEATPAAQNVWELEQALAKAFDKPEDRLDPMSAYHLMPLTDVQDLMGDAIDLNAYLKLALNDVVPQHKKALVRSVDYLPKMAALVKAADKKTLSTYMVWHVILSVIPYMPLPFRMCLSDLESTLTGVSSEAELWEKCVDSTEGTMGFVTGAMFVEKEFSSQDKADVKAILAQLRETLVDGFPLVSWMDDTTRERAIDKANGIIEKIGYPEFIMNPAELDEYYDKMNVTKNKVLDNSLNARKYDVQHSFEKLLLPTDRTEWHMVPSKVNAYYNPSENDIVFPAGILQSPIYNPTFPRSVKFGTLGMIMGHELSHAFDNSGRLFDVHGNLNNWWTNESAQSFLDKTGCLVDQYNSYVVEGEHVNGKTTLSENIADNAGLPTAYLAYKSMSSSPQNFILPGLNMTSDQLFFLGFAQLWCTYYTPEYAASSLVTDPHTNAKYRVIGTLQNMPQFSEAFQCSATSNMNPAKKCSVW